MQKLEKLLNTITTNPNKHLKAYATSTLTDQLIEYTDYLDFILIKIYTLLTSENTDNRKNGSKILSAIARFIDLKVPNFRLPSIVENEKHFFYLGSDGSEYVGDAVDMETQIKTIKMKIGVENQFCSEELVTKNDINEGIIKINNELHNFKNNEEHKFNNKHKRNNEEGEETNHHLNRKRHQNKRLKIISKVKTQKQESVVNNTNDFFKHLEMNMLSPHWFKRHGSFLAFCALLSGSQINDDESKKNNESKKIVESDNKNDNQNNDDQNNNDQNNDYQNNDDQNNDNQNNINQNNIKTTKEQQIYFTITLPDLLIKNILEILYFDKFSDFISDQSSAPVREAAAFLLKLLYPLIKDQKTKIKLTQSIFNLLKNNDWQVLISGLLCIDQLFPELTIIEKEQLITILSPLINSQDEDVRYNSANILIKLVPLMTNQLKINIVGQCWNDIKTSQDISLSKTSIILLLSEIYKSDKEKNHEYKSSKSYKSSDDNDDFQVSLRNNIQYLFPCFRSPIHDVRKSILVLFISIFKNFKNEFINENNNLINKTIDLNDNPINPIDKDNINFENNLIDDHSLLKIFSYLMQNIFIEEKEEILKLTKQLINMTYPLLKNKKETLKRYTSILFKNLNDEYKKEEFNDSTLATDLHFSNSGIKTIGEEVVMRGRTNYLEFLINDFVDYREMEGINDDYNEVDQEIGNYNDHRIDKPKNLFKRITKSYFLELYLTIQNMKNYRSSATAEISNEDFLDKIKNLEMKDFDLSCLMVNLKNEFREIKSVKNCKIENYNDDNINHFKNNNDNNHFKKNSDTNYLKNNKIKPNENTEMTTFIEFKKINIHEFERKLNNHAYISHHQITNLFFIELLRLKAADSINNKSITPELLFFFHKEYSKALLKIISKIIIKRFNNYQLELLLIFFVKTMPRSLNSFFEVLKDNFFNFKNVFEYSKVMNNRFLFYSTVVEHFKEKEKFNFIFYDCLKEIELITDESYNNLKNINNHNNIKNINNKNNNIYHININNINHINNHINNNISLNNIAYCKNILKYFITEWKYNEIIVELILSKLNISNSNELEFILSYLDFIVDIHDHSFNVLFVRPLLKIIKFTGNIMAMSILSKIISTLQFKLNYRIENFENHGNYRDKKEDKKDNNKNINKDKNNNDNNKDYSNDFNNDDINDINKDYSNDINKDYSNDINKDYSDDINKDDSNDINKDYSNDINKGYSNDINKGYSNDINKGINDIDNINISLIKQIIHEKSIVEQLYDPEKLHKIKISPLKVKLRNYQIKGIEWINFLRVFGVNGILADDMGLGKTVQVLGYLESVYKNYLDCVKNDKDDIYDKDNIYDKNSKNEFYDDLKDEFNNDHHLTSIVICPSSLIDHWINEIKNMTNLIIGIPYRKNKNQSFEELFESGYQERSNNKFDKNKTSNENIINKIKNRFTMINNNKICGIDNKICDINSINNNINSINNSINNKNNNLKMKIIITSYESFRSDYELFIKKKFFYLIIDEGHILRNRETLIYKRLSLINSTNKLILTGTPIQNSVDDLFSLFNFLMPGYLGDKKYFNSYYLKSINQGKDSRASENDVNRMDCRIKELHKKVLPFIMRRLKSEVLKDLPEKVIKDVLVELSSKQRILYDSICCQGSDHEEYKINEYSHKDIHDYQNDLNNDDLNNSCNNITKNILKSIPSKEQITYGNIKKSSFKRISEQLRICSLTDDIYNSCKISALNELIKIFGAEEMTNKILIFCQLKTSISAIKRFLEENYKNLGILILDGTIPSKKRQSVVDMFFKSNYQVLLLTTSIGGLGLNLTCADTVIFFEHDWNPFNDLQAMDRAHRLGQKKVVNVFRIICKDTIEEDVMSLQNFKVFVANCVVSQQNSSVGSMDLHNLLDNFEVENGNKKRNE
ncbi:putative helicase mot1 [Dictyocoela muelleri]|nr:putative helicase mot1 [Dictyocoela muelleri]